MAATCGKSAAGAIGRFCGVVLRGGLVLSLPGEQMVGCGRVGAPAMAASQGGSADLVWG